jgi:hypothetical protein
VVDVGDHRDRRARHDLRQALRCLGLVAGAPHDVAPGGRQRVDLLQRPSFTSYLGTGTGPGTPQQKLARAFALRTNGKPYDNQFDAGADAPHDRPILWLFRPSPRVSQVTRESEDDFDQLAPGGGYRLELRLVYWYPLRIPFANWVMATMYRAWFGFQDYRKTNPLIPTRQANWTASSRSLNGFRDEFLERFNREQYVFPIIGTATMHMMTPPRREYFRRQHCDPTP